MDLAGRQRMLTQRIAKAACFLSVFSDVEKHHKSLQTDLALYDDTYKALRYGDAQLGFPRETDPNIIEELQSVTTSWSILRFAGLVLEESPYFPDIDVDIIADFNEPTLAQSHRIVETMDRAYNAANPSRSALVSTINIAGRQRMLTQKAAKEFCFITYGRKTDSYRKKLKDTIEEFDRALEHLRYGNLSRGIVAAPTKEIEIQIAQTKINWQKARPVLWAAASGKRMQSADFRLISNLNLTLLSQSNQIVKMLVAHQKSQSDNNPS